MNARRLACGVGVFVLMCVGAVSPRAAENAAWLDAYREPAARLIGEAVGSTFAWQRLAVLTDSIGNRVSGSESLNRAIRWAVDEMKRDGLENVHTEKVMVPKWVRGAESAEILEPAPHQMMMLGLGDSVGTPPGGVQAQVMVVHNFEQLEEHAAQARGRIVLFNVPFTTYGETVRFRSQGASRAAKYGAVAVLVRSVGPPGLQNATHRCLAVRGRRAKNSGRGDHRGGRGPDSTDRGTRNADRRAPEDGGAF